MKTSPSEPRMQCAGLPVKVRDALIAGMLPWVKLQARRMVRRDHRLDFDDLAQAGALGLMDAADTFRNGGDFFLHSKARVRWRMSNQAKSQRRFARDNDACVDSVSTNQPTPFQLVQRREIRAALAANLTRAQAIAFTFYFVEGCSAEEIAALVGGTQRCVARLLSGVIRKLAADPRLRALAGVDRAAPRTPGEVKQRLNGSGTGGSPVKQQNNGSTAPKDGQLAGNGSPRTDAGHAQEGHKVTVRGCSPGNFSSPTTGGPSKPQQSDYRVSSPRRRIARADGAFVSLWHPALSA